MINQIQLQIVTVIFILFFTFTFSPISIVSTIFNIHIIMYSSSINSIATESTLPCSYVSHKLEKSNSFLKKLVLPTKKNKVDIITPSKHIPITIPAKLTKAQKEAALPFLAETNKSITAPSKSKKLSQFFKKIAKATPAKDCLKSSSTKEKKKTQYKLTFIPIINKKQTNEPTKAEATEIVWYDSDLSSIEAPLVNNTVESIETTATEYAQRIWDEDQTVYNNLDHVVEWIGDGKPTSTAILESYMAHFDFEDVQLEQAFRDLCSKLHFKGETQQIDRILLQFSARYFECNPNSIFGSTDVVHAIVYSLLLLNTDLHVAQGDHKKMTQSAFIKNTMNAISGESLEWIPLERTLSQGSDYSTYPQSLDSSFPRKMSAYTIGSKTWQSDIKDVLKQMYNGIRQTQLTNPSSPPTSMRQNNNRLSNAFRRSLGSVNWKEVCKNDETDSIVAASIATAPSYVASQIELPSFTAPYYKEGMVTRKHLLEKTNQKAKHRDWKDCYMVIERSQLRMYKLSNKRSSDTQSMVSEFSVGGNWMSNAQLMGAFDLKHTLATILPSGYSRQRQHTFTLQQSNGAVYVFQAGSAEQVEEWVSTCNYWAARESKEPLAGGISSLDYGWGASLYSDSRNTMIHEWLAPACPTISSILNEADQLQMLRKHVEELTFQLDQHRDVKSTMIRHFTGFKSGSKAMANWDAKARYLLHETIKYQNYCNSIENSLAIQASM
ncbi:unnamed protein product [Mucor hiemalis]